MDIDRGWMEAGFSERVGCVHFVTVITTLKEESFKNKAMALGSRFTPTTNV